MDELIKIFKYELFDIQRHGKGLINGSWAESHPYGILESKTKGTNFVKNCFYGKKKLKKRKKIFEYGKQILRYGNWKIEVREKKNRLRENIFC